MEDYAALLKPRVMSLVVFTALVGMVAAPGTLNPVLASIALLAIAAGRRRRGRSQHVVRRRYRRADAAHARAADPGAAGSAVPMRSASASCSAASPSRSSGLPPTGSLPALLAFTIFFYVAIYTAWLKRLTAQNIVIGGAAGALPPVIGWAAMTGHVSLEPLVYFLIVFMWTPPHFWALALFTREDYARVGIPMMPNVAGDASTRRQILVYSAPARADRSASLCARPCRPGVRDRGARSRSGVPAARNRALATGRRERQPRRQEPLRLFDPLPFRALRRAAGGSALRLDFSVPDQHEPPRSLTPEQARRRRRRSVALAVLLAVLVVLFYVIALLRGPGVLHGSDAGRSRWQHDVFSRAAPAGTGLSSPRSSRRAWPWWG